jgi:phenylalanyl-tRNA synthetase beta chain
MRYEKSLDPELCDLAMRQTVALLTKLHPHLRFVSELVDVYTGKPKENTIVLPAGFLLSRAGVDIPHSEVEAILGRLGFGVVTGKDGSMTVTVPTWRATKDISIPEDVVEEVLRIWGYERVASSLPVFPCAPTALDPVRALSRSVRQTLSLSFGGSEIYSYAFVRPEMLQALGRSVESHLKLANPLSDERPYLTHSLVPQVLEAVLSNQRMFARVCVFEIERVFLVNEQGVEDGVSGTLPAQPYRLAIAYSLQGEEQPFYFVRSMVEEVLVRAGYTPSFVPTVEGECWMHASRQALVEVNGQVVGSVCEVDPDAARVLGLERRTAVAELDLSAIGAMPTTTRTYEAIPLYPDVKRDLAFVVANRVAFADVERVLRAQGDWLKGVELFDVYEGGALEEGKKSLAVHLTFRAPERTLSSEEVDRELKLISMALESELGATVRA